MTRYKSEYRINKRGCECFRTDSFDMAKARLDELNAKRPGVYTLQSRQCQLDRYGVTLKDATGKALWESWR